MYQTKKQFKYLICTLLATALLTACTPTQQLNSSSLPPTELPQSGDAVRYQVDSATFSLNLFFDEISVPVSLPNQTRRVENLTEGKEETKWDYPEEKISVSIKPKSNYLRVTLKSMSESDHSFTWPIVSGEEYYLPLGEGKQIPRADKAWGNYLKDKEISVMEQLSMPFFATVHGDHSVLVIMEHPYRSNLIFSDQKEIRFQLKQDYPEIDPEKERSYRIYLTDNNPVSVAKLYRSYVEEQGRFVSLKEKAKENPNIQKLYGAPHIYLWGENLLKPSDINWKEFRNSLSNPIIQYILSLDTEAEGADVASQIAKQDYVDRYQKNVICRTLSTALKQKEFYNSKTLPKQNETIKTLLSRGIDHLSPTEQIQLHKHALAVNLPDVFQPVENWMNSDTIQLFDDLTSAGINQAWIGLNSWEQAYAKPELVKKADESGYLIASYDSYHSIHEPGKEQWITAQFEDTSLYENSVIQNQDGDKAAGFQNVGRKLNPTLSLPAVKNRMKKIFETGLSFHSWFIDCDATGEIYDDYTPSHKTTQKQDLNARLERMAYIRDKYDLVIGSEGGNDFAASTIAFAHGIELPTFSWMDNDMRTNKESPYYIGGYYSPTGGVAAHFAKQIPIKDEFYPIFLDPKYELPLFKLVYNDSVITGYHWDWSTFKIQDRVQDRMLREVLFNTPPLYHLDRDEWEKYKKAITEHHKIWSPFSKKAIQQEMTAFSYLSKDSYIQQTQYGRNLSVTANFRDTKYIYKQQEIPPHSLLIEMDGEHVIYTPSAE